VQPIRLGPNFPQSFYRGSHAISAFRGDTERGDIFRPEDWIASTTPQFGRAPAGMSVLPAGRLLADAIAADPLGWLGPAHIARHGEDPALLVKLLDAGQRLPVHVHPDREFAGSHLQSRYGKTEAWLIVDAAADAAVHLGFSRDVESAQLSAWCQEQDVAALLAATNRVPVSPGDAIFVPAGLPHAIGPGILLVELQEPTDFSIFLEWKGFDLDGPADGHLGLGYGLALQCVDRAATGSERIDVLRSGRSGAAFPAESDAFFRAERISPRPVATLDPGYSVLIVLEGAGELSWTGGSGSLPVRRGDTILVPYGAGELELGGEGLAALRARPPV
jgi:mannose-6-phosphate isomerase